jgi:cytochrome c oxidase cbb3-type subunit III
MVMFNKKCLIFLCTLLLMLSENLLAQSNQHTPEQTKKQDIETLNGEKLFQKQCSVCHGSNGHGGVGIPLNLDAFLSTASDHYLFKTIQLGRPGRVMPDFKQLSEQQIYAIIRYIRSWKAEIKAPVYSPEPISGNIDKGRKLYNSICLKCHKEKGTGGKGTGVTFSRPREAEIIAPAIGNPAFLASASDQMIKHVILKGRQSTPMLSAKEFGLQKNDVNHIVSYLRSLSQDKSNSSNHAKEPVLVFESSYSIDETIENIKQAAMGFNFRYIRKQTLNHGFVDKEQENKHQQMIYFCNFSFLNQALLADPRIGMFLPFRVTLVKKKDRVLVMTVNPNYLCEIFNNDELKPSCNFMSEKYEAILEESTL